jgi:hypothetical protein
MQRVLSIGDRVHVTTKRPVYGYQPGCKGTVRSGPETDKTGKTYYSVTMDKDGAEDATFFLRDEIERDG